MMFLIRFASEQPKPQPKRQVAPKVQPTQTTTLSPTTKPVAGGEKSTVQMPAAQPAILGKPNAGFAIKRPTQPIPTEVEAPASAAPAEPTAEDTAPPTESKAGCKFKVARPTADNDESNEPDIDDNREYAVC